MIIIPADSTQPVRTFTPADEAHDLSHAVGDWLEIIRLSASNEIAPDHNMYVNEEGILLNLPLNERASKLVRGPQTHITKIFGDVVIAGPLDGEDHAPVGAGVFTKLFEADAEAGILTCPECGTEGWSGTDRNSDSLSGCPVCGFCL